MLKVLIVDDEKIVRDELRDMVDWEKEGYEIIGMAADGVRGLKIFESTRPDIIITDIKMPAMDGIEMVKKIHDIDKNTVILLLTAYKDADYTIQAMNLGVKRYLVKYELEADILLAELNCIRSEINKRQQDSNYIHRKILDDIINGRVKTGQIPENLNKINISTSNTKYAIAILRHGVKANKSGNRQSTKDIPLESPLEGIMDSVPGNERTYSFFKINHNEFAFLFHTEEYHSELAIGESVKKVLCAIQKACRDVSSDDLYAGISGVFSNPCDIALYREQAVERLEYGSYMEEKHIVDMDVEAISKSTGTDLHGAIHKLLYELINWDMQDIMQGLREIFKGAKNAETAGKISLEIIYTINRFISEQGLCMPYEFKESLIPERLNNLNNISGFAEFFKDIFSGLIDVTQYKNNRYSANIIKALNYISRNYMNNITLEDMADDLEMSKGYFCSIFKKELGQSFVSYLSGYRINMAKKMLKETNKKVYEVAFAVGFYSSQHFSLTFKKLTGFWPMDYKNSA